MMARIYKPASTLLWLYLVENKGNKLIERFYPCLHFEFRSGDKGIS